MDDMLEKMRREHWRIKHELEQGAEEAKVLMTRLDALSEKHRKQEREMDKLFNAIETAERVVYGEESEIKDGTDEE